jgi:glycosyltransferase involved in cell wall biosynthesis
MKIGIDGRAAKWYRGTGIGNYTYQLLNYINKIDNINDYLLFLPDEFKSCVDFNPNFFIRNISQNKSNSFWEEVNIPNLLQNNEVELYHVPQNGIGLSMNKHCRFVITLHDIIPYKMPETVGPNYLKLFLDQMPNIIEKTDAIITVSNFSKDDISSCFNFPKDKIYVTYLAAEDIYKPINKYMCKNFLKEHYSIDKDYILYIGGYSPRKNIIGTMEAFSKLIHKYKKELYLVIGGSKGISYPIYKEKAIQLGIENKVIFTGFIPLDHLPYFYSGAEIFVYPSFYEGFGLPPIEAMSCGVPVITSNVTSVPEISGDAALLVNPYDIDMLYNSMYEVLSNQLLRKLLVYKGLKHAKTLSWKNTAKNTLSSYEAILKK